MGQNSDIEWTHHTFNPWWGCVKVSPGCANCYAETWANRYGHDVFGPAKTTQRRTFGDKHWNEPLKWDRAAKAAGVRQRVFCASMGDVFEDHPQVEGERLKLFNLILKTPWLDWLLLTKRPQNIRNMVPGDWLLPPGSLKVLPYPCGWPANIWIGTSVENQEQADKRIPELLRVPAAVRFLSCEPLLGPVDLRLFDCWLPEDHYEACERLHWVICGGESGPKARPMHPDWARSLRDQCVAAGVAFHFKQWGEFGPRIVNPPVMTAAGMEFPDKEIMTRFGKHAAGRLLDGQTWDQFPT